MQKLIYLREIRHEIQTEFIAYTTLTVLLQDIGISHLYTVVRNVFEKNQTFTYNNNIIRKITLKRNPYGKRK